MKEWKAFFASMEVGRGGFKDIDNKSYQPKRYSLYSKLLGTICQFATRPNKTTKVIKIELGTFEDYFIEN